MPSDSGGLPSQREAAPASVRPKGVAAPPHADRRSGASPPSAVVFGFHLARRYRIVDPSGASVLSEVQAPTRSYQLYKTGLSMSE